MVEIEILQVFELRFREVIGGDGVDAIVLQMKMLELMKISK